MKYPIILFIFFALILGISALVISGKAGLAYKFAFLACFGMALSWILPVYFFRAEPSEIFLLFTVGMIPVRISLALVVVYFGIKAGADVFLLAMSVWSWYLVILVFEIWFFHKVDQGGIDSVQKYNSV